MTKGDAAKRAARCAARRELRFWVVALVVCAAWLACLFFFGGS